MIHFLFTVGLKKRGALSPLLFSVALQYAIKKVQKSQEELEFNGTRQLLVYTNIYLLGKITIHKEKHTCCTGNW